MMRLLCYSKEIICYGHNPQGTQRVQCRVCKKVWTPKQLLQREIAPPERIETVPLIVPFQGESAGQKLYVLLTFDTARGNILHLSTNFTQHPIGETLRYCWKGHVEPDLHHSDIVQRVDMRNTQFLNRSQFDEIQYGSAVSLAASRRFIHTMQTALTHNAQLSAGHVTQILFSLVQSYNSKLTATTSGH